MITLYHYWDSFCSFKVRFALAEKHIKWKSKHIDLMRFENLHTSYLAVNPSGLVPTLIDGNDTITESTIINEYLEDQYAGPSLRPSDPVARSRMRHWVKHEEEELFRAIRPASLNLMMKQVFDQYSDEKLNEFLIHHPKPHLIPKLKETFRAPFDGKAVAESRKKLSAAFNSMDQQLTQAPWLAGNTFSLADIAAAPVVDRVIRLGFKDLWIDLAGVTDWVKRLTLREGYCLALPRSEYRMPKPK